MTAPAAEFIEVTKIYRTGLLGRDQRVAVSAISLSIQRGEVFGLLGPNRAGKTTLVKLLLSLARPTSGTVKRLGEPISKRATLAKVGYVHENHAFPKYLTGAALLEYYGALTLLPHNVVRQRIPQLLERVGLADRGGDAIRTYSKGMVQRLGLAQALINDPELLVLDEPSEGLDLGGRQLIADIIRERRSSGKTVLIVSHVLREVEPIVDRIGVVVNGQLAHLGTVAELTHRDGQTIALEDVLHKLYSRQMP
jgi:ABC-2 type transport system ATP-binding protein